MQENFFASLFATILGGALLTSLLFFLRERAFPFPEISGHWILTTITKHSAYNPYKNLAIKYEIIIWREGSKIKGTGEKFFEISTQGRKEYLGKKRRRTKIEGSVEKNYLKKDKLYMHMTVDDFGRESTYYLEFKMSRNIDVAHGFFRTMVASQMGHAELTRIHG